MQDVSKPFLPNPKKGAAMTAALFLISLNALLIGSLAIRRPSE